MQGSLDLCQTKFPGNTCVPGLYEKVRIFFFGNQCSVDNLLLKGIRLWWKSPKTYMCHTAEGYILHLQLSLVWKSTHKMLFALLQIWEQENYPWFFSLLITLVEILKRTKDILFPISCWKPLKDKMIIYGLDTQLQ